MGKSIILSKISQFKEILGTKESVKEVTIDGKKDFEKVSIKKIESNLDNFFKYHIKYAKKTKRKKPINISGKSQSEYIENFEFYGYRSNEEHFLTLTTDSHEISQSALKKLNVKNSIKSDILNIDLILFTQKVKRFYPAIEISSGWFTNLKLPNLNSVKLKGDDVNKSERWLEYITIKTAKITNIEITINDTGYNGEKISVSTKGFIYTSDNNINDETLLKISKYIIEINNKTIPQSLIKK